LNFYAAITYCVRTIYVPIAEVGSDVMFCPFAYTNNLSLYGSFPHEDLCNAKSRSPWILAIFCSDSIIDHFLKKEKKITKVNKKKG